jgi:hypothetical protein
MPSVNPDADKTGSFDYFIPNGNGLVGRLGIQSGASPIVQLRTAGFGAQIVAADGVTVLLNVPETGFSPTEQNSVQLVPKTSAPPGLTEGAIWYSSVDHAWHGVDNTGDVTFVTQ